MPPLTQHSTGECSTPVTQQIRFVLFYTSDHPYNVGETVFFPLIAAVLGKENYERRGTRVPWGKERCRVRGLSKMQEKLSPDGFGAK